MTGKELKQARNERGLSRRTVAELAGLHPDSIRYWERKPNVDPRGHAPRRILKALDLAKVRYGGEPQPKPAMQKPGYFWAPSRARDGV